MNLLNNIRKLHEITGQSADKYSSRLVIVIEDTAQVIQIWLIWISPSLTLIRMETQLPIIINNNNSNNHLYKSQHKHN